MSAIESPDMYGAGYLKRFIAQQATSLEPNLAKQIVRYFDPTVYDTSTLIEQVQSNLRITTGLREKLNVWGEPVKGDPLSGLTPKKFGGDPLKTWMAKNDLWVPYPSKNTKMYDPSIDDFRPMNKEEMYEYVKRSGKQIHETLWEMLPEIRNIPDQQQRQNLIDRAVQNIRQEIRADMEDGL